MNYKAFRRIYHADSALSYMTPQEFLATYEALQAPQKSLAA